MIRNFSQIRDAAINKTTGCRIAVAAAADKEVLAAVYEAMQLGIATFTLIGDADKMQHMANDLAFNLDQIEIINEKNPVQASLLAVKEVSSGRADLLMKGLVSTSVLLKAVLNKEVGLRTGKMLSHVAILEAVGYNRLVIMTDGGMLIQPDLKQKIELVNNAVTVARKALQIDKPHVAPLCAVEKVNPAMPATTDAALLTQMNRRGQIQNCIIDGPLNLNGAISPQAAEHIGLKSPVAGKADILLVPFIEVGNVLYKSMVYFAGAQCAGIVVGARAPIVLTSRADSHQAKVNSIATAVLMA